MLLFAEKVILAAVVPLCVLLVVNPMKFDRPQQISAAIVLLAMGYFVAHSLQRANNERNAIPPVVQTSPGQEIPPASATGSATTSSDSSPAVTGNGNKIDYGQPPDPKKDDKGK